MGPLLGQTRYFVFKCHGEDCISKNCCPPHKSHHYNCCAYACEQHFAARLTNVIVRRVQELLEELSSLQLSRSRRLIGLHQKALTIKVCCVVHKRFSRSQGPLFCAKGSHDQKTHCFPPKGSHDHKLLCCTQKVPLFRGSLLIPVPPHTRSVYTSGTTPYPRFPKSRFSNLAFRISKPTITK